MSVNTSFLRLPNSSQTIEVKHSRPLNQGYSTGSCTVLFLPFWGGSASTFDPVIQQLAKQQDVTLGPLVSISYPGTGKSPPPEVDSAESHSIRPRAELLASLIDSPDFHEVIKPTNKLIIVAHSMSAKIAYELLDCIIKAGKKGNVAALLLLGPAPPTPFELPLGMQETSRTAYDSMENARFVAGNVLTVSLPPETKDQVVEAMARDCYGMSPGSKQGWPNLGMKYDCTEAVTRVAEALPGLNVSVMVGREDKVESIDRVEKETVDLLHRLGFDVRVKLVENCGHIASLEQPGAVANEIVDLLSY